ncbi:cob(I)yrinic acid a,c-diamide adenosyltransferase [Bittarella massiliensis (ex Durand et al. 2017)]|uniref:Cob(I)yrinic acid a,c-diamide adenosyltransferase n=1 Tax=Bittarella massiliensis (ex Durand et al. 2017) TaxID=1720313 RepID=A0ABW9WTV9_9FIRM|nr:cob(I)yrinic acid a,c-diamide adenosyltransferase [Bittarella massiliensis (ex Durand et al. 2017)]MZL69167.1 cob(I)yrinic acid a,c-diamide adenosyltransferase [Bittarella massiliensis (ex Durand et al. 2017)]
MAEERREQLGLVHIYTGDGKGKTTASVGLCVRALGAGERVYFTQFLKGGDSAELESLRRLGAQVCSPRTSGKFYFAMDEGEKAACRAQQQELLAQAAAAAAGGTYRLVVCDEIMAALSLGLVEEGQVLALLAGRDSGTEVVLTGRDAPPALVEQSDYCTEMCCRKHPFERGVPARKGIEF